MSNTNYLIVLLLVTLLAVGVTALIANSLVRTIVLDTKVFSAKNKANQQLDSDIAAAPKAVDNYNNLGSEQALIANSLPNTADYPGLIAMLENLSSDAGVTLKSVSPSQGDVTGTTTTAPIAGTGASSSTAATGTGSITAPAPQPLNVSLAFDGSYATLQQLLTDIEQSSRPMRVTSMQLSGSATALSIELEATTYYQDKATLPFKTEAVK